MNIPANEQELMEKAANLAGLTLAEVAADANIKMPKDLKRHKGWVGLLLEQVLGASASSRPVPDFPTLGIELKTLPITYQGIPLETTFVCVAPLTGLIGVRWQNCWLKKKLAKVLWVPIICDTPHEKKIPLAQRRIGSAFLWSPSAEEEHLLALDWQELTDMIVLGEVEKIQGKHGQVLQLRPKAANAQAKTQAFDLHGKPFMTLPRGFYLKTPFTQALLTKNLRLG